jgi:hypothetical protein
MDDEVMAWRVVAYHLAGELGLRQDRVDEAVIALREVAVFTFGLEASPRPASLDLAAKSGAQRPDRPNGSRYPRVGRGAARGSANPRSLS